MYKHWKMKTLRFFPFAVLLSLAAFTGTAQVKFSNAAYAEVQQQAKAAQKPILIDFHAAHCGACRKMEKTTFQDASLGQYVAQNFIAVAYDLDQTIYAQLAQDFNIRYTPTIVVVAPSGKVLTRFGFTGDAASFRKQLEKAIKKS